MPSLTPRRSALASAVATLAALVAPALAQGTPIGFVEDFALAPDRSKALELLIPGTEEHYEYQCRVYHQTGRFAEAATMLKAWENRYGRTGRLQEAENRQALLTYTQNPAATLGHLQRQLGLRFDHQRELGGTPPDLATRLDPATIAVDTLTRRALLSNPGGVNGFTARALPMVAAMQLDDDRLMSLLSRLDHPDIANLPALVVRNLADRRSRGFGSLQIHNALLLAQLEECLRLRGDLLGSEAFQHAYLRRLVPSADVQWQRDPLARLAYLERLGAFADRLTPAENSLKAHVLYHRLRHDLAAGTLDRARLLAYLRLPRPAGYANAKYLERNQNRHANLGATFPTELPAVGDDAALVQACLAHFLRGDASYEGFSEVVDNDYLRRLFAETKILAGTGDTERWYSLLDDPGYYERLKERVDIEFAPTQPAWYGADQPVSLDVDIKNVPTLLVRVFEIHTLNYYREVGKEVDASITLDGLVANVENTLTYSDGPLLRVRRHIDLPALQKPGVYVVELIGNGTSSRAVIHKGRLWYTERLGAAGHALTVCDESGVPVRGASAWLGGREYVADRDGEIVIPYSTKPGDARLVLRAGDFATLSTLRHRAEAYQLSAAIHVDREALLARRTAKVLVRPQLRLNGQAVSLELLEQPTLVLTATDTQGVDVRQEVRGFQLHADRESVHEFRVPDGLAQLTVQLHGKTRNLSNERSDELASNGATFRVNGIDPTDLTACPTLARTAEGYVLDVRGKEGEPKGDRVVQLTLQHRLFTDAVHVTLKTDANGRVHLGFLPGIERVRASGFPNDVGEFALEVADRTWPASVNGVAGSTLRVPYQGEATTISRAMASFLEVRGGQFVRDAFDRLALAGGFVELRDLEAGDYDLWLREADVHVAVRVTAGAARNGWAMGRDRALQLSAPPLHIVSAGVAGDELRVQLANAGARTRVHLIAARHVPAFDPFAFLMGGAPLPAGVEPVEHGEASYHVGRDIGEEYRYILERRFAARFPGNMLRRPSLLLNPWALDETPTTIGLGGGAGGKFGGRGGGRRSSRMMGGPAPGAPAQHDPGTFANLDYLPAASVVLANLRADAQGLVRVPLASLGDGQHVHVVAIDDTDTVHTTLARAEAPLAPRSRRLRDAITGDRHVTEQRRIEFVATGGTAVLADGGSARAQTYDSLASVFQLFATLNPGADLSRFAFLLTWPDLTPARKRELYSDHACHELHFFLRQKDPAFFAAEVQPFLTNKLHKTFLDQWLLGTDLTDWLEPRAFARLNVVERILLARTLTSATAAVRRLVGEQFDLQPPDLGRADVLFASVLKSGAMDDKAALGAKLDEVRALRSLERAGEVEEKAKKLAEAPEGKPGAPAAAPAEPAPEADAARAERDGAEDLRLREGLLADKDVAGREQQRRLYRAPDPTKRYVEHAYWHQPIEAQDASLITVNGFWRDFAQADPRSPFTSANLAEATRSFAEMMLALAVLDLPFRAGEHAVNAEGATVTLRAASPLLLVRKEIVDAAAVADAEPILVNENFFRLDDRYRFAGNERRDAFLTGEFLVDTAYGCQVVVTNPTSTPRRVELLLQIPANAIPVRAGFATRGMPLQLDAYGTASVEYFFYFPVTGKVAHYPVHVSEAGRLVAFAAPRTLDVVAELSQVDTTSWAWVSQNGTTEATLAYLDSCNLLRTDLGKIAWRMRDRAVYGAVVARLRGRLVYHDVLWSYAIHHHDVPAIREYLRHADGFLAACGRALASPLVDIDPVERRAYQHVEFDPIFNPRAHRFGKRREVLNRALAEQYGAFLAILADRDRLDAADWLSVAYYQLLQDRVEEALAAFGRVDAGRLPTRVQYDYLRAYLDFFSAEHAVARGIATRYQDYPIPHWRSRFKEILAQLDEADGAARAGDGDPAAQQGVLAATEPALELAVEGRRVALRYRNLTACEVSYYRMDVEFLFSTHPFVQQGDDAFAYIRPNLSQVRSLVAEGKETVFDLPAEFQNANVLVEVRAGGITRRQAYYANSLTAHFIESYGQVQVTETGNGRPMPRVYVKVFARLSDGRVRFHKDGYTDLRGRFDYASLSGEGGADASRYAVLVLSDDRGAMTREVEPPQR